jgi:hypothetical protein
MTSDMGEMFNAHKKESEGAGTMSTETKAKSTSIPASEMTLLDVFAAQIAAGDLVSPNGTRPLPRYSSQEELKALGVLYYRIAAAMVAVRKDFV